MNVRAREKEREEVEARRKKEDSGSSFPELGQARAITVQSFQAGPGHMDA